MMNSTFNELQEENNQLKLKVELLEKGLQQINAIHTNLASRMWDLEMKIRRTDPYGMNNLYRSDTIASTF